MLIRRYVPLSVMALVLTLVASNCKSQNGKSKDSSEKADIFGGSNISELVLKILTARLKAQASLSSAQADVVAGSARAKLATKAASLRLAEGDTTSYLDDYTRFAGDLTVGAIQSFVDPALGLKKRTEINNVLSVIVANTFAEMKGRMTDIDDPKFPTFITSLTKAAVSSLTAAGYPSQDLDEAITTIMKAAVGNLRSAGILTEKNGGAVVSAIVQGAVMSLGSLEIKKTTLRLQDEPVVDDTGSASDVTTDESAGTAASDAIIDDDATAEVYQDYEVSAENIDSFDPTTQLTSADPSKLEVDKANSDPKVVYAVILYKLMKGVVPTLKDAGFQSDETVAILKMVTYSMLASLDEAGLDEYTILSVLDEGVYGALDAIGSLGLDANDTIKGLGKLADGAVTSISKMDKFEDDRKHLIVETVTYILASRAANIETLTGKNLERAFEQIVADATRGLSKAGFNSEKYGEYAGEIVSVVLASAQQVDEANTDETFDISNLAEGLAAVALASGSGFSTDFATKFKAAIQTNEVFTRVVGNSFNYDEWYNNAKTGAEFVTVETPTDVYGDPALSEPEATTESTSGTTEETSGSASDGSASGDTSSGDTASGDTTSGSASDEGGSTDGGTTADDAATDGT